MPSFQVTPEAIARVLLSLQPPGDALPREFGTAWADRRLAMAEELTRAFNRILASFDEFNPASAQELLPEWETSVGFPGCVPIDDTQDLRRSAVLSKFKRPRSPTASFITEICEDFGFVVTVNDIGPPAVCGEAVCGEEFAGPSMDFFFEAHSEEFVTTDAVCGAAVCGDPMGSIAGVVLQCLINELKALHMTPIFIEDL